MTMEQSENITKKSSVKYLQGIYKKFVDIRKEAIGWKVGEVKL